MDRNEVLDGLIARLDELEKKATPGPWTVRRSVDPDGDGFLMLPEIGIFDDANDSWWNPRGKARENMKFIAALRNAWPEIRKALAQPPSVADRSSSD